jgi:acetoacetate decarboxylase
MGFIKTMDEITENFLGAFEFYDAEMLTILFETKIEIIKRLIPPPLEPANNPTGMVFVANYPKTNFGVSYLESALFLDVIFDGDEGVYCLAMPVSNDMAMIGGRETFGYPKKIGNISFERNGNDVKGWTERHGTRFLDASAKLTGKFNDEKAQSSVMERFGDNIEFCVYNFKYFPSPDLMGFDYNPRLIKETVKFNSKTIQLGEAELQFKSSTHDPWGDVDIVKVIGAVYTVGDNTMLPGKVVAEVDQTEFIPYALMKVDAMR